MTVTCVTNYMAGFVSMRARPRDSAHVMPISGSHTRGRQRWTLPSLLKSGAKGALSTAHAEVRCTWRGGTGAYGRPTGWSWRSKGSSRVSVHPRFTFTSFVRRRRALHSHTVKLDFPGRRVDERVGRRSTYPMRCPGPARALSGLARDRLAVRLFGRDSSRLGRAG